MLRIMLQKIWHKKWMNLCLILGSILLIATVVSFPIYQESAYNRMLLDEFDNYISSEGKYPAMNTLFTMSAKGDGRVIKTLEEYMGRINEELDVVSTQTVYFYQLAPLQCESEMNRTDINEVSVRVSAMSDMPAHSKLISGTMYSESGLTEDGAVEVVVSPNSLINLGVLVGETLDLRGTRGLDGKGVRIKVVGVITADDNKDFYWQVQPDSMENVCLMNYDLFRQIFLGENVEKYTISCYFYPMFDYKSLKANQVDTLMEKTRYLLEESANRNTFKQPSYIDILETYSRKQGRIAATLQILQIPVLIMLGAFLFMISGQMYDMERNEISVIKSRGSSGGQIFRLYLYQSIFLSIIGGIFGIPLGMAFSNILGSARNFLEFDADKTLPIVFTRQSAVYAVSAMLVTLVIMAFPAIKHSRVTIVKLKQQKALKTKSWWEKIFLDFIILGVSLYGFYSFRKTGEELAKNVLRGEALDPLLYISSSLFIVGMGMVFLRIQPWIVQLIYLIGKRFWKPASYASFMENRKNGHKQQFIMLFLIMTISLGMYHATVARTILQNAEDNADYLSGADIIIQETWHEIQDRQGAFTGNYVEPKISKYSDLDTVESYTRVLYDTKAIAAEKAPTPILLMGIHTKEFGQITNVKRSLLPKHYYEYLNELAVVENGILVSENFQTKLGHEVGDILTYTDAKGHSVNGKIVDFVPYWPGYSPVETGLSPDGDVYSEDKYLVIANYDYLKSKCGLQPYEVWMKLKENADSSAIYDWIAANNLHIRKFEDKQLTMRKTVEDPLLQGTNGVLTMGFIVTILLCAVGYLIYWIMNIRSREMIFGVLRACGMHKGELFQMLMNEQIFSGVFSVLAGIGIGKLASVMFVPMLQQAYAAANQVLPMSLIINNSDMMRLYGVIAAAMIICLAVLILLLFKLNVAKALKLGEE